ncbi:MAG: acyl-CoA dehydrogenase family protein [Caulobacteraceae bacterium]
MRFELTEEQELLRDQVRGLLLERATPALLRRLIEEDAGWDEALWRETANLGLLGAAIPEANGGVGLGALDLCVIAEEMGRFVAPIPFFSSICLAAEAIVLAGSEAQKAAWLPKLASGEVIGCFALTEGVGAPNVRSLKCKLTEGKLSGAKSPVADAEIAHMCVLVVRGGGLALVEMRQPGVVIEPLKGFDQLRRHARVRFDGAKAELLNGEGAAGAWRRLLDRAAVYEAFEQIGGAESALFMARDYALQRFIFGRQLASYQAVKHNLANILVSIELARSNGLYAAGTIDDDLADAAAAAATARLGATQSYETAARENLQTHGGIGFTWEANCHFHYRRARLLALNLGSLEVWTNRLIGALAAANDAA